MLIGVLLLFRHLLRGRVGLAFAAIRENEVEARASGLDPVRYKLFAFGLSACVAGIAGALEIHQFGYVTPEVFGTDISFWPIIYSICRRARYARGAHRRARSRSRSSGRGCADWG